MYSISMASPLSGEQVFCLGKWFVYILIYKWDSSDQGQDVCCMCVYILGFYRETECEGDRYLENVCVCRLCYIYTNTYFTYVLHTNILVNTCTYMYYISYIHICVCVVVLRGRMADLWETGHCDYGVWKVSWSALCETETQESQWSNSVWVQRPEN